MDTFAVVLDAEGASAAEDVEKRLRERYERVYRYLPNCIMVAGKSVVAADIARTGGLESDGIASGAVFRIASHAGYADLELWRWFKQTLEESGKGRG